MRKIKSFDFRNWSIRNKILIVCVLCILIPMAVTASLFYNKANNIIAGEVSNYTLQILNQVMGNVEKSISDAERISMSPYSNMQVLDVLGRNLDLNNGTQILNDREIMVNFMSGVLNVKGDFTEVNIFTEKNENYSIDSMNPNYNFKDQDWYKVLSRGEKEWVILGPHFPTQRFSQGGRVLSFVRPIRKFSGNNIIVGYFSLDINYNSVKSICDNTKFGENGNLYVLDDKNNIVYSSDNLEVGQGFKSEIDINSKNSNSIIVKNGKSNKLVSHITSPYTQWKYICTVPVNQITSNVSTIITYTILVGLICILFALAISILLSFAITKPLKNLTNIMKNVEEGDLEVHFQYSFGDEIGVLSKCFNNMIANMKDLIKRILDFKLRTKEAELEALQSKINPHFLYNTLQSIQMKAVVDGNRDLADMIDLLGNYMRFSISSMNEIITLNKEFEYLKRYIDLQKIRFGEKLNFKFDADEKTLQCKILKLILQPLVENAIYHGLEKKQGDWMLLIKAVIFNGRLHIEITDNGVGLSSERLCNLKEYIYSEEQKDGSIGLKNVHDRLKLVFEEEFEFKINSIENIGTKIEISLPAIFGDELDIFKIKFDKNLNKI